jgi:hypothetical protein
MRVPHRNITSCNETKDIVTHHEFKARSARFTFVVGRTDEFKPAKTDVDRKQLWKPCQTPLVPRAQLLFCPRIALCAGQFSPLHCSGNFARTELSVRFSPSAVALRVMAPLSRPRLELQSRP